MIHGFRHPGLRIGMSRAAPASDARRRRTRSVSIAAAGLLFAAAGLASGACAAETPLWEIGLATVAIDQQAYPGSSARSRRSLLVPYGVYRGPVFRAADGQVGLRALRGARFEVDLGASAAIGSDANAAPRRAGMPGLGTLVELGPRLKIWPTGRSDEGGLRIDLPVRAVFDASDGLASRGFSFEPRVSWQWRASGGHWLRLSVGAVLGDRRLNDLFYGVSATQVTASRPSYDARAGLIATRVGIGFGVPVGSRWFLGGFARWDDVAGAANRDSPLVDARRGWSVGVTVAVRVLASERPAFDATD
jgi:outer membrane scaffolding protein for murein synthesis (MipA/OmpV family)